MMRSREKCPHVNAGHNSKWKKWIKENTGYIISL